MSNFTRTSKETGEALTELKYKYRKNGKLPSKDEIINALILHGKKTGFKM